MRRAGVVLAVAVLLGAVTVVAPPTASAAPATTGAPAPNEDFCTPFADYYQAQFVLALISGFAEIGEGDDVDEDEVRATYALALSPKLLEITRDLHRAAPKVLRANLAEQVRVYRQGVEILRDAGVPPRAIREIAALDINSDRGDYEIEDEIGISEAKLKAAGRRFAKVASPVIDWKPPRTAATFLERAVNECGLAPDTRVDCGELLDDGELTALLGGAPTIDDEDGCVWEVDDGSGDERELGIDVYASAAPFERFSDQHETTEQIPGLGDAAVTSVSYETSSAFKSCGRTLVVRDGARTVQVALCLGDEDVPVDRLRPIAELVLTRL